MADEQQPQPAGMPAPDVTPAPAAFMAIAEAARSNAETTSAAGQLEQSNSWQIVEAYLRAGARAAATVPPEAQLIVAAVLRIVENLNATRTRSIRRSPDREAGNAYVPWALLVQLIEVTDAAFPGMIENYTGKDYLG